jgi:hypothetical protein
MSSRQRRYLCLAWGTYCLASGSLLVAEEPAKMESAGLWSDAGLLRDFHSKRASSWDRTGGNEDWVVIQPGKTHVLLEEKHPGCVKHFYWTYIEQGEAPRLNVFRGLVLRAFWDGADKPSIEVPLGDFFGVSNGQLRPIRSLAFTTNPGADAEAQASWGFNCYLPMPFTEGGHIEVENQGQVPARIWFHIDYEWYDDRSGVPERAGRLHAQWNRVNPTKAVAPTEARQKLVNTSGEDNYTILSVEGNGQFVGYFLTVANSRRGWWGEGDDMIFIDGEGFPPSIHGTGTEEIFGGGASPATEYTGPYTGFHCIENRSGYRWWGTTGAYRFYIMDPLRFRKSIRVSLEHGHANDLSNDYSSVAFWYQQGINRGLPPLPPLAKRQINFNFEARR